MKKKLPIIIIAILIVAVVVVCIIKINSKLKIHSGTMRLCYMSEAYDGNVDYKKELYAEMDEDSLGQKIRQNDIFPSDDIRDYVNLGIITKIDNTSWLPVSNISAYIHDDNEESMIITKEGSIIVEKIDAGNVEEIYLMGLLIYKGDKSDEEIIEYVKTLSISIYYANKLNSHKILNVNLSDIDFDIDIIDWNEQMGN